jgi:uncharacterized membrane protein YphA (DoxX/SURF4 family)
MKEVLNEEGGETYLPNSAVTKSRTTQFNRSSAAAQVNWLTRHVYLLKTAMRVVFGIIWAIDGALKFQPGLVSAFPSIMESVASGQPSFLKGWFSFWSSITLSNPGMFITAQGIMELSIAFALIFGLLRKVAYVGGFLLSLLIWAVPEGFGGPYGPSSTDIGTGIVYAIGFLFLITLNTAFGPSKYSLDRLIECKWPSWKKLAEIQSNSS